MHQQIAVGIVEQIILVAEPMRTAITFQNLDPANTVDVYDTTESVGLRLYPQDAITYSVKDGDMEVRNGWYAIASVALTLGVRESLDTALRVIRPPKRRPSSRGRWRTPIITGSAKSPTGANGGTGGGFTGGRPV